MQTFKKLPNNSPTRNPTNSNQTAVLTRPVYGQHAASPHSPTFLSDILTSDLWDSACGTSPSKKGLLRALRICNRGWKLPRTLICRQRFFDYALPVERREPRSVGHRRVMTRRKASGGSRPDEES